MIYFVTWVLPFFLETSLSQDDIALLVCMLVLITLTVTVVAIKVWPKINLRFEFKKRINLNSGPLC